MNLESVCLVCLVALFVLFLRHYQHARSYAAFIRPLSVFYLLLFLWMFYNWTIYHALRSYSHSIYMWLLPLDLCIASWVHPVLYYYIYRLLSPSLPTTRQLIRHSFYPALATTCMLYFIFQSPKARELSFLSDCFDRPPLVCLLRIGLCLQTIIYCLLIRQLMRSLRPQQFQLSIQGTRINVRWIWVFIIPGMMSVVGHGLFCFLHQSSILHLQVRIILFCAWVLWLLSQSISITGYPALVPFINPNSKVKMDKKISSSEASRIMKQLREVVESEKLYLNPKCSLDLLASKVGSVATTCRTYSTTMAKMDMPTLYTTTAYNTRWNKSTNKPTITTPSKPLA